MMQKPSCCHCAKGEKKPFDFLFWGSLFFVTIFFFAHLMFAEQISIYPWLETMSETSHSMLHAMWWGIAIGAIFIGLLSKIPREFIIALLGEGGTFKGLLRATLAGVLLDLCSHGILMVASKLYERGASTGQVMAFLLASPWNSFSLTLILIGLIGVKWTLLFIIISMVIALISGYIFDKLVKREVLPANVNKIDIPDDFEFWTEAKSKLKGVTFNASLLKDIVVVGIRDSKMVVRWLLLGILLAGLLRVVFDPAQFEQFFGPSLLGLGVTIFMATILEVCSEGSVPIAADILRNANAPGNAFTFLMAGVATDYTEIMVLKDTTKSWKIALFLPLITVPQILIVALLINFYG